MNPSDQARQVGVVDSWLAQTHVVGSAGDPTGGMVLGDTGALAAGFYDVTLQFNTTVALHNDQFEFEWRNAGNDAIIFYLQVMTAGAATLEFSWHNIKVADSERIRGYVVSNITGIVRTAILAVRRA